MTDEVMIVAGVTFKDGWICGLGAKFLKSQHPQRSGFEGLPNCNEIHMSSEQIEELQKPACYPTT